MKFFILNLCLIVVQSSEYIEQNDYYNEDLIQWNCDENSCQICDLYTGECCDSDSSDCFIPDPCRDDPCLFGGICIPVKDHNYQNHFECTCKIGSTGKYCELKDYFEQPFIVPMVVDNAEDPIVHLITRNDQY